MYNTTFHNVGFCGYPENPMMTIRKLLRLEETTLRLGGVGDNWHNYSFNVQQVQVVIK
jgi:hypothetical protein